jgi:hypothetical protein
LNGAVNDSAVVSFGIFGNLFRRIALELKTSIGASIDECHIVRPLTWRATAATTSGGVTSEF